MEIIEKVASFPLFEKLTDKEKKILWVAEQVVETFDQGQVIIREGSRGDFLYLMVEGKAVVTKSAFDYVIAEINVGEVFGEMAYLTNKRRYNNIIASDDSIVLKMGDAFFNKVGSGIREKIKDYLILMLADRLDDMNKAMIKVASNTMGA